MRLKKVKQLGLALALFFGGTGTIAAQYNVDYKIGPYQDNQTIESTVDIGDSEVITVGTLRIDEFVGSHTDVIVTRLNKDGKVIWNLRYGERDYHEAGNGVTLSWDRKHIIVVGNISKRDDVISEEARPLHNALVLKIRISDGALIWSTIHGIDDNDDQAFLVKRSGSFFDELGYVIVGTSTGDRDQSFQRMYSFKVKENGNEIWSNRYLLPYNFPIRAIRPTAMVEYGFDQFMIAGLRYEVNRPTRPFTVGIRGREGAVIDDLIYYDIENVYNVSHCDIDRHPEEGWGLSFTADSFSGSCFMASDDVVDRDVDRIGVLRLNNDRKVVWGHVYWGKRTTNNSALSLRLLNEQFNVCVNINTDERYNTPGLLRLKEDNGWVNACNTYHIPATRLDYGPLANHMIYTQDNEFNVKSIYSWGFSMVNTDLNGYANCDNEIKIARCPVWVIENDEKLEGKEYGKEDEIRIRTYKVEYRQGPCYDSFEGLAPEESGAQMKTAVSTPEQLNKIVVYPSPLNASQAVLNVQFLTDLEETNGTIKVYGSQGQEVLHKTVQLINGENRFQIDANQFTSGIYLVMIEANGTLIDRTKFVKK